MPSRTAPEFLTAARPRLRDRLRAGALGTLRHQLWCRPPPLLPQLLQEETHGVRLRPPLRRRLLRPTPGAMATLGVRLLRPSLRTKTLGVRPPRPSPRPMTRGEHRPKPHLPQATIRGVHPPLLLSSLPCLLHLPFPHRHQSPLPLQLRSPKYSRRRPLRKPRASRGKVGRRGLSVTTLHLARAPPFFFFSPSPPPFLPRTLTLRARPTTCIDAQK